MADTIRGHRARTIIIDDVHAPVSAEQLEKARRWFRTAGADPTVLEQALSKGPMTAEEFHRLYCNHFDPSDDGPEDTRL